jgi:hypothetical protein
MSQNEHKPFPPSILRIPEPEPSSRRTIIIEDSLWAVAKHLGRGNATAGIRQLLLWAATQSKGGDSGVGSDTEGA